SKEQSVSFNMARHKPTFDIRVFTFSPEKLRHQSLYIQSRKLRHQSLYIQSRKASTS
ncbi:hypothetical protein WMY93_033223, partial [Mugilogobius chulae]